MEGSEPTSVTSPADELILLDGVCYSVMKTAHTTVWLPLLLRLCVHVVLVFLVAAFLSGRHVRGGRNHSGLARAGVAVQQN